MASGAIVQQFTEDDILRIVNRRLSDLEGSDGSSAWIPVSTVTGNPYSPGYENGWDDVGGATPLEFKRFLNWTMLRGGFFGGVDGSVVFTLPELFWPDEPQQMLLPLSDGTGFGSVLIDVDGTVTYVGTCACGGGGGGTVEDITSPDGSLTVGSGAGPDVTLDVDLTWLAAHAVTSIDGGGGALEGDITLSAGTGITLNQVGQNIEIENTGAGSGTISLIDSPGASIDVTNPAGPTTDIDVDPAWLSAHAVTELDVGTEILVGPVTISAGTGISLAVLGGDEIQISATGSGSISEITSTDLSVTVTNPTGPIVDLSVSTTGIAFDTEPQTGDWLNVETTGANTDGWGIEFDNLNGILIQTTRTGSDSALAAEIDAVTDAGEASGLNVIATATEAPATGILATANVLDAGDDWAATAASLAANSVDGLATALLVQATATGLGGTMGASITATSSGSGAATGIGLNSTAVGSTDAEGISAFVSTEDGEAIGAELDASSTGAGDVIGLLVNANTSGDGPVWAQRIVAESAGLGDVIGLQVQALTDGAGTVYTVLVLDPANNPIFRIDPDGSVHIKTGTAILADL